MQRIKILLWESASLAIFAFIWIALVPSLFILLYTTIEMQSAARSAAGENIKLATFSTARVADRLKFLIADVDLRQRRFDKIVTELAALEGESAASKRDAISRIQSAWNTLHNPEQIVCDEPRECFYRLASAKEKLGVDTPYSAKEGVQRALLAVEEFERLGNVISERKVEWETESVALNMEKRELYGKNESSQQILQMPSASNLSDDVRSVALSFNKQRDTPMFEYLFFLPSGVIVAFFTGLMGAIGSAIYSLMHDLRSGQFKSPAVTSTRWQSYGARPLLGALAGFTVFFVVSAGATFLIQPSGIDATQAVNQLSPPALASLGIFAGLSSERALEWLIDKAQSFFGPTAPKI